MSEPDSLLVEDRPSQNGLVIERSQDYAFHALGAIRSGEISWVSSIHDASKVLDSRKIDYILSGVKMSPSSGHEPRLMVWHIMSLAFKHRVPACFIAQSDNQGMIEEEGGYLTFRGLSLQDLVQNTMHKGFRKMDPKALFREMKSSCTMIKPGNEKNADAWVKAAEIVQNLCMRPIMVARPPLRAQEGPKKQKR